MSTFKLPTPSPTLPRNGFDLSTRRVFTAPAGALLPVLTQEVNPGEHFSISVQDLVRTQPLNTAAFARCKEYYHFFFVPYKSLWSSSDRFFTGVTNGDSTYMKPDDIEKVNNTDVKTSYVYNEVHPDRSDKLITMLHYLADDGDDESLGTFLYTPDRDGKELDVFKDRVKSSPYISNCVLFFSPRDEDNYRTNHCMANKSDKTFLRKSFQTFWIKEESDWTKDKQKGRVRI